MLAPTPACCRCAGYVGNFKVDLRDGTTIAEMMRQVLDEYNVPGTEVYADNLFLSVDMLRWCKRNSINLAGTCRRGRGYPEELRLGFSDMNSGDVDWRMTEDGLLSVAWMDVGCTKAM